MSKRSQKTGEESEGNPIPLTAKGKKIKKAMQKPKSEGGYGKDKGEQVFYASQNKGNITGTEKKKRRGLMN